MALQKSLVLFPLLTLLLLELGWAQPSLGRFQREHMDTRNPPPPAPSAYCNRMMSRRNIIQNPCKTLNTFIHENLTNVQAVCYQTNVPCFSIPGRTNCYESNAPMNVTECRLTGSSMYPNCQYTTNPIRKHIVVACLGNPRQPVHYDH
ncbi:ribonuclease pancreatic-like [Ctenodactylus gundi]